VTAAQRAVLIQTARSRDAAKFAQQEGLQARFGFVWCAASGQPGAPWRSHEDVAAFASKIGARPPGQIGQAELDGLARFDGISSPVFAEMRFARADLNNLTLSQQTLENESKRAGEVLTPSFLVRGLIPSEFSLWRGGVLAQTSRFHLRPYVGRCPRPGEVSPQVMLEHWRWLTQRRGQVGAYLRAATKESTEKEAFDLPQEVSAGRQAALIGALLRGGAELAPAGEFDLSRLPSPPRAIAVDPEAPQRRLLIGELSGLLVIEFSPASATQASSHLDEFSPTQGRLVVALTLSEAFRDDAHLLQIARTFDHLTTHVLILRLAARLIAQMRELATADDGDRRAVRTLWRGFMGAVESLWGWGECNDLHAAAFDAFDRAFRLSNRWSLVLQRGGQLATLD